MQGMFHFGTPCNAVWGPCELIFIVDGFLCQYALRRLQRWGRLVSDLSGCHHVVRLQSIYSRLTPTLLSSGSLCWQLDMLVCISYFFFILVGYVVILNTVGSKPLGLVGFIFGSLDGFLCFEPWFTFLIVFLPSFHREATFTWNKFSSFFFFGLSHLN